MDYIYIDTSIFESDNFLEGSRINSILELSEEGYIRIVLPAVTYNEIKNRIRKGTKEAFDGLRNKTRILRNAPSIKTYFSDIDTLKVEAELIKVFEERISKAKSIIIPYPTINIEDVFENYYENKFPFGKKDKKHEFPDAFALVSLEEWCKVGKRTCHILSNDKDLLNYKSKSLIIENYEEYVNKKLKERETIQHKETRLKLAKKLYKEKKEDLIEEIELWVTNQVDDERFYFEYVDNADIYNIDIQKIKVEMLDYQFTSITNHGIKFETEAEISFRIELEVEDVETGYYDSIDKEWYARETRKERIDVELNIPIQLEVDFPEAGDDYSDIKIYEINNNKKLRI